MPYTLPALPYPYDALEPHVDAQTMEIHHAKHHQAYIDKCNVAVAGTAWEQTDVDDLLRRFKEVPADRQEAVRNHGGGHANHSLFWTILSPKGGGEPSGALAEAINRAFGSAQDFKTKFSEKATGQFGSGWAWLVIMENGALSVENSANQDSPLMDGKTPILGLDVWEHAYYLRYKNKRPEYVAAFWQIVHWHEVGRRYEAAIGK